MNPNNQQIQPFTYLKQLTLAASLGATVEGTLTLEANSMFELLEWIGVSSEEDGTEYRPNYFSVEITDQSTGRNFSNSAVPQCLLTHQVVDSGLQNIRQIVFPPSTNITFKLTNLTANAQTVTIGAKGYKLFSPIQ